MVGQVAILGETKTVAELKVLLGITAAPLIDDREISNYSGLFLPVEDFQETNQTYQSDRNFKFSSRALRGFSKNGVVLMQGGIPDLRFHNINLQTKVQDKIDHFLKASELLLALFNWANRVRQDTLFV
jgi:hypothetical protein